MDNFLASLAPVIPEFAAVIAAITAILVAFLTRQTQLTIVKLQKDVNYNTELIQHDFEKERNFISFKRDRIAKHLDEILESYLELDTMAHLIRLKWWHEFANSSEGDKWFHDNEKRFYTLLGLVRVHVVGLNSFGSITEDTSSNILKQSKKCEQAWQQAIQYALMSTDIYKKENPDREIDPIKEFDAYSNFESQTVYLGKLVMPLASHLKDGEL